MWLIDLIGLIIDLVLFRPLTVLLFILSLLVIPLGVWLSPTTAGIMITSTLSFALMFFAIWYETSKERPNRS